MCESSFFGLLCWLYQIDWSYHYGETSLTFKMDPQAFIRLSVGLLALRSSKYLLNFASTSDEKKNSCSQCSCEIKLRGFPVQTTYILLMPSLDAAPRHHSVSTSFYLEESDLRALLTPGCFYNPNAHLEIYVFTGKKSSSSHCGIGAKRQQFGVFKLEVGPEWGEGKPLIPFNG